MLWYSGSCSRTRMLLVVARCAARYAAWQWQCTVCPLPSKRSARADAGNEDKGRRLLCFISSCHFTSAGRRGQTRQEEMIMTQDKARKAATRQRMAETGEPYSVARHAVARGQERAAAEDSLSARRGAPPR